jgi:hypothetical protein
MEVNMEGKLVLLEPPAKRRCKACGRPDGQKLVVRVEGLTIQVIVCPACDRWGVG